MDRPPRDGWILLKAGEAIEVHDETPVSPSPRQLQMYMMNVRGTILSGAFNVESAIDIAILSCFFGGTDRGLTDRARLFQDEVLRETLSLDKKIKLVSAVARDVLATDEANRLSKALNDLRSIRNVMAHYPCWLEPVKLPGTDRVTGFRLFLAKGQQVWEITEEQVSRWCATANEALEATENLARLLNKDDAPAQKAPGD